MSSKSDKEYVSRLIVSVITQRISVREAILHFPKTNGDKNLLAAYHALIHYEADEDIRNSDLYFKEEQDEYLNMIAELLANDKDLPKNIVKSYDEYYSEIELPKSKNIINVIKKICNFLNIK